MIIFSCNVSFILSTGGIDISDYTDVNAFSCLVSNGYDFTVVRAWQSLCQFDSNAISNIKNAWAGGMKHVDVYLFPSFTCSLSATEQVNQTLGNLLDNNVQFGQIWFDIETGGGNIGQQAQQEWLNEGVAAAVAILGEQGVGIYSSPYEWTTVMGNWDGPGTQYPLWYAHYDNNPSFSDYGSNGITVGAWTQPAIKQYAGTTAVCGASVDLDWYP